MIIQNDNKCTTFLYSIILELLNNGHFEIAHGYLDEVLCYLSIHDIDYFILPCNSSGQISTSDHECCKLIIGLDHFIGKYLMWSRKKVFSFSFQGRLSFFIFTMFHRHTCQCKTNEISKQYGNPLTETIIYFTTKQYYPV